MYKLLYAGFDTIDLAIRGSLPSAVIDQLHEAREEAAKKQEPALCHLAGDKVAAHVAGYGAKGGYAFLLDTGPNGANWRIKDNSDPNQWNIFVSPRATMLLGNGYAETFRIIEKTINDLNGKITAIALNRVDFAMDFQTLGFELEIDRFVTQARSKLKPHWSKTSEHGDSEQLRSVINGRRVESVTIGSMPGRQVIVYDKRAEAIAKHKTYWFEVWGVDRGDPELEVWRVEVRAGKKHLKDAYNIRTLEDFEHSIGDVIANSLERIRYLAGLQTDSNVSRQALHPIWRSAQEVARDNLIQQRSGLTPDQVRAIERDQAALNYRKQIIGNAIGFAIASGQDATTIPSVLPQLIAEQIRQAVDVDSDMFAKAINRSMQRLHFVASSSSSR